MHLNLGSLSLLGSLLKSSHLSRLLGLSSRNRSLGRLERFLVRAYLSLLTSPSRELLWAHAVKDALGLPGVGRHACSRPVHEVLLGAWGAGSSGALGEDLLNYCLVLAVLAASWAV